METVQITLLFHPQLRPLLHPSLRQTGQVKRGVNPGTTVKDAVESLRVPHTEVGQLLVCGRPVDFGYQVREEDLIEVLPMAAPVDPCSPSLLRPEPLAAIRFMVDVNVAKLGSLLRMAGIDATCRPDLSDMDIAAMTAREGRILLSRDRGLLKRRAVVHGHLVRNQIPEKQLAEIVDLYGLRDRIHPFSRCMLCNTSLVQVDKSAVLDRLEPLTRKYYHTFYLCPSCDKIYWPGTHKDKMNRLLAALMGGK